MAVDWTKHLVGNHSRKSVGNAANINFASMKLLSWSERGTSCHWKTVFTVRGCYHACVHPTFLFSAQIAVKSYRPCLLTLSFFAMVEVCIITVCTNAVRHWLSLLIEYAEQALFFGRANKCAAVMYLIIDDPICSGQLVWLSRSLRNSLLPSSGLRFDIVLKLAKASLRLSFRSTSSI